MKTGEAFVHAFCQRLANVANWATDSRMPLREQAGVFIGFAVGAIVQSGVPRDQVLGIVVDHVRVALAEMQTNGNRAGDS